MAVLRNARGRVSRIRPYLGVALLRHARGRVSSVRPYLGVAVLRHAREEVVLDLEVEIGHPPR